MVDEHSRWTDPAPAARHRADGRAVDDPTMTRTENRRIRQVARAWVKFNRTGDRSRLIALGVLPAE